MFGTNMHQRRYDMHIIFNHEHICFVQRRYFVELSKLKINAY